MEIFGGFFEDLIAGICWDIVFSWDIVGRIFLWGVWGEILGKGVLWLYIAMFEPQLRLHTWMMLLYEVGESMSVCHTDMETPFYWHGHVMFGEEITSYPLIIGYNFVRCVQ